MLRPLLNFAHVSVVHSGDLAVIPRDRHGIPARFGNSAAIGRIASPVDAVALPECFGFVDGHYRASLSGSSSRMVVAVIVAAAERATGSMVTVLVDVAVRPSSSVVTWSRVSVENKTKLALFRPNAPICRVCVDLLFCFGIHPAAKCLTTGKDNQVGALFVDYGELKLAIERCRRYGLPHGLLCAPGRGQHLI